MGYLENSTNNGQWKNRKGSGRGARKATCLIRLPSSYFHSPYQIRAAPQLTQCLQQAILIAGFLDNKKILSISLIIIQYFVSLINCKCDIISVAVWRNCVWLANQNEEVAYFSQSDVKSKSCMIWRVRNFPRFPPWTAKQSIFVDFFYSKYLLDCF